ncbi:MAG: N-acetylmuramoyl-L-alanine amidase [Candidatus Koribacter versatilis]|nr:N-acetylmuramoyl-L-alanine amidase [Candidatus Koribacter versatilis]
MPSATTKPNPKLAAVLAALVFLGAASSGDEKRVSIYSSVATYTLPVIDRTGREYVGLLEVLEPLGRVSASVEGQHWKLRYNNVDSDFVAGRTRTRIRGRDLDLTAPFLIESSRGLVPISSLSTLLPRFLGNPVNFHEAARRLFIGDVATQVTAQLDSNTPPRLVLNFTAAVNPTISTEPGKLRMVFAREPLVPPGTQSLSFDNKIITQATFSESNGAAELTVAATAPLMASFSNNGRTITIAAASPGAVAGAPPLPESTAPASGQPLPVPGGPPSSTAARRILAVVDPAHGGSERGAALTETLAEKNVTLGFARLLRHELEQEGFSVILLREGDDTLTLDQRAGTANTAHAAIYISLHAASQGSGARVYTALLPREGPSNGPFHAWNAAQAPALPVSQNVAAAIVSEMQKHQLPARGFSASLRPLNNLLMPALAVELAPGPNGVSDLPSANYQQKAAAAIASAVASQRDRLGAQP